MPTHISQHSSQPASHHSSSVRTIGVSTGGGDCPGLNAVIRAVVKCAVQKYGWKVIGIEDGFDGLIWPEKSRPLTVKDVSGILPRGGTILGTTNRGNPFKYKFCENGADVERDCSDQVVANARALGIDAMVVIGGDGTLAIGLELFRKGLNLVGVPKTIDNDLCATEVTFGFDTALHTATDAVDKIHTTAESHHRIMLVEVMGRDAGWIALETGIAGGAHVILIPEIPFTIERVCNFVVEREKSGKKFTIIVVAEGIGLPADLALMYEKEKRTLPPDLAPMSSKEKRTLPRGRTMANLVGDAIGMCAKREVRVTVLGHIQRGGSPSPFDRILSTRFGVAAVELVAAGQFGKMVCLRADRIHAVDIAEAIGQLKQVDPEGELVHAARSIGICFGD
jgi:ATP-dependent phosphofructokinase / diphosphate-dependent phosphofructokinase